VSFGLWDRSRLLQDLFNFILENNMSINKIFEAIPFRDACSLHQRMLAGNSDAETRTLLRTALRNARCEQRGMKAEMK
jgi:hypothetical protein